MAGIASAVARLRAEPFADFRITEHVDQLCGDVAHVWRDTLLTPLVTLRLFALQILHGNTAITHLRQLGCSGFGLAPFRLLAIMNACWRSGHGEVLSISRSCRR